MKGQQLRKVATQTNKTSKKAKIKDNLRNDLNCGENWIYLRNTNMQRNSYMEIFLKGERENSFLNYYKSLTPNIVG